MKYMNCLLAATVLSLAVQAQENQERTIAKLVDLHGNVLVSRDAGLGSGSNELRLSEGTRVITTAKSEVIVEYDDGCRVQLKENQRFEVERGKPCALLLAQDIIAAPIAANNAAALGFVAGAVVMLLQPSPSSSASAPPEIGGTGGTVPISPN